MLQQLFSFSVDIALLGSKDELHLLSCMWNVNQLRIWLFSNGGTWGLQSFQSFQFYFRNTDLIRFRLSLHTICAALSRLSNLFLVPFSITVIPYCYATSRIWYNKFETDKSHTPCNFQNINRCKLFMEDYGSSHFLPQTTQITSSTLLTFSHTNITNMSLPYCYHTHKSRKT